MHRHRRLSTYSDNTIIYTMKPVDGNNCTEDVEDAFAELLSNEYVYQKRELLANKMLITMIVIIMLGVCLRLLYKDHSKEKTFPQSYFGIFKETWMLWVVTFLTFAVASLLLRMVCFFTELSFLNIVYNGDLMRLFKATCSYNICSVITTVICLVFLAVVYVKSEDPWYYLWSFDPISVGLVTIAMLMFSMCINLNGPVSNLIWGTNAIKSGVDHGTGMAFSYYYGYLRIIIPSNGAENPGLIAKMKQYEFSENCEIPVKKLFILIPESGYIPPDLAEVSNYWLEKTKNLPSEIRDRAGTRFRPYGNTVYKIHPGGEEKNHRKVYLTVEGATPMLTLYEIISHFHEESAAFRDNRNDLVAAFYKTLKKLLDSSPDTRDTCELVYYKDYDDNGKLVNIAEILLERIRKQASMC